MQIYEQSGRLGFSELSSTRNRKSGYLKPAMLEALLFGAIVLGAALILLPGSACLAASETEPAPAVLPEPAPIPASTNKALTGGIQMMRSAEDDVNAPGKVLPGKVLPGQVSTGSLQKERPASGSLAIPSGEISQPKATSAPVLKAQPASIIKSGGQTNSSQLRGGTMVIEGGVKEDVPRTPEDVTAYLKKMKNIIESYNAVTIKLLMNGSSINTDPEALAAAQAKTLELVQAIRGTVPPEELTEAHGALADAMGAVQGFFGSGDFGNMTSLFRAFGLVQQVHTAMQRYESGVQNCIAFYKLDPGLDPCSGDDAGQKEKLMRGFMELQQNKMAEFQKAGSQSPSSGFGSDGSSGLGSSGGGFGGGGGGGMPNLGDMMNMLGGMGGGNGGGAGGSSMGGGGGGMPNLGDMMNMLGGMGGGNGGSAGGGSMGGGGGGMPNLGDMMNMLGGMGGGNPGGTAGGTTNSDSMGDLDKMMQDMDSQ